MKVDPCLVVNGRSHVWWPLKDPCLVTIGMFHAWWPLECEGKNTLPPLPFSPTTFTYALNFFPWTPRFYFTMVLSRYSRLSFLFFDL
jgi:hypothetical protein